ncbi:phosphoglycerate kinase [Mesonia sp. HuA40]|uniref:phosphoglycerate kinase n=1 Tax=Mesonia sp. HuA40 TaxID=2602761 RepID=UPI0011CB615F|nr:phosphoglycerate kinase [Mesonia sp. HuA40]TXK72571.1 phosphoglycerate kinase [Mesonia sp. HuA40]
MKTIDQFNFKDKKALIRVDFNVPLNEDFEVTDTTRILAAKPSIDKILNQGGAAILMSHLGRPENQEQKYSLKHIVPTLSEILGVEVKFVENCVGSKAEEAANQLKAGEVLLLENLRYHKEEKQGDSEFAKALASLGDIYVNDAFGTAHRAHASTTVVAQFFEQKCFGYLLAKEIESINKVFQAEEKPVTAILGGAKVSSKITVISHILDKIDHLIIGGGMTFTFIKALGGEVGSSLVEDDKLALALQILEKAKAKKVQVHLPVDAVIADAFKDDAKIKLSAIDNIPENWMGLDVGPETSKLFEQIIQQSQIILWNGPVGVFEMSSFAKGTLNLGNAIAKATKEGAFSLVGGGDSVAAVKQFGLADQVSYVSTGGGAMLEMLEGKELPGIVAINKD